MLGEENEASGVQGVGVTEKASDKRYGLIVMITVKLCEDTK